MFRGNPGFQLSIILLVLFVCFVLQVQNRPYMSSAEKDVVLLEHRVKAEEGHEYHKVIRDRIDQAIKKLEEKKAREARMQGRFSSPRSR